LPGKNVHFDDETWHALEVLARDRKQKFQDLADEAFFDLLKSTADSPQKRPDQRIGRREFIAGAPPD
jgi:hypothetical protein